MTDRERALMVNTLMAASGVSRDARRELASGQATQWQIAPRPLAIGPRLAEELQELGRTLYTFYQAANRLYHASVQCHAPKWVHEYLDQGKPEALVKLGRMARQRNRLPMVIRPDLFISDGRLVATELDSVPGGMGLLGSMTHAYASLDDSVLGGNDGIAKGFAAAIAKVTGRDDCRVAVVVSDESRDYYLEMNWLARQLRQHGHGIWVVHPEQVAYDGHEVTINLGDEAQIINTIYRFFELFDIDNVPNFPLMLEAVRKRHVEITPPLKTYLEEKMLFALYHHPSLRSWWTNALREDDLKRLDGLLPQTWILDPRELPPHAAIPDLWISGHQAQAWQDILLLARGDRSFVIKPSGFSPLAWGSRGVQLAFELSNQALAHTLQKAQEGFQTTPYILQRYHRSDKVHFSRYGFAGGCMEEFAGRTRLCPFYFIGRSGPVLAGVLATICPLDKPLIHGMTDAVMVPVMVSDQHDLEIDREQ